jgi:hypothetical protein
MSKFWAACRLAYILWGFAVLWQLSQQKNSYQCWFKTDCFFSILTHGLLIVDLSRRYENQRMSVKFSQMVLWMIQWFTMIHVVTYKCMTVYEFSGLSNFVLVYFYLGFMLPLALVIAQCVV